MKAGMTNCLWPDQHQEVALEMFDLAVFKEYILILKLFNSKNLTLGR